MSSRSSFKSLIAVVLIMGALGGCHKSAPSAHAGPLPDASTLISQAETAMSSVQSVHFTLNVDGTIASLPVKTADGVLTHAGNAKGTATATALGATMQVDFVILDGSFYFKGPTGGYQKLPLATATSFYDPSAILDPNRGIAKILSTSTNPKTVAAATIDGKTAYEVSLTPDPTAIQSLIPGVGAGVTGSIWIDKDSGHVAKGVFTVPNSGGKAATVTITLTNFDAPVTINAP
jgi:lipoprotein LprG